MQQSDTQLIPLEAIEHRIHVVRGLKVMLDKDLAKLYQVPTKRLNEQVKRNIDRFPLDFMFQLSEKEALALRSHSATSKTGRGGRRYLPYVFTEHGALMLASVLTSTIAVDVSIVAFWPYPIPLICAQGPYVNQMRQSRFFSDFPYSSLERVFMGM